MISFTEKELEVLARFAQVESIAHCEDGFMIAPLTRLPKLRSDVDLAFLLLNRVADLGLVWEVTIDPEWLEGDTQVVCFIRSDPQNHTIACGGHHVRTEAVVAVARAVIDMLESADGEPS